MLLRSYHQSDAAMKRIDKFFELYTGQYKVNRVLGDATYELTECDSSGKMRGKFNVRLLKRYYETKVQVSQESESCIDN